MPEPSVRVLMASRSPAYAVGVAEFLRQDGARAVVAGTVEEGLEALRRERYDATIIDERRADAPGRCLAAEIRREDSDLSRLVALEGDCGCGHGAETRCGPLAAGAHGRALHACAGEDTAEDALTGRERVVLRLMRQQLTYQEIAVRLGVSWHTVRGHARSILRQHGMHSRRELDSWDSRRGPRGAGHATL